MAPAERRRAATAAGAGRAGDVQAKLRARQRASGPPWRVLAGGAGAAAALVALWQSAAGPLLGGISDGVGSAEARRLLAEADAAIRKGYDYPKALGLLERAVPLAPRSAEVLQFYASVLLSLGRAEEAWAQLGAVFRSRSAVRRDPHFLQQYVLTLHRLGKQEELSAVWPAIMSTPGIQWRSPLQCPDLVDEGLLEGAEPFPRPEGQRVPELLERHKAAIVREFEQFWKEPSSMDYFSPNQDNDLVAGDRPRQWTEMLIFDKGQWDAKACGHLPTVCGILRGLIDVEGIVHGKRSGQVSLLKLEAGATLVPHFGSVNWRYVAHLGLLVPEGVEMRAGNESRRFVEGELLLLDDSFLHSVQHGGVGPRVTLFVNFFHPKARPVTHAEWLR